MTDMAVADADDPSFTLNPDAPVFVPQATPFGFHSLPASPALLPNGFGRGSRNRSLSYTDIAMMSPLLGPLAPLPPLLDPLVVAAMLEMSMPPCGEDNDEGEDEWSGSAHGRLRLMSQEEITAATAATSQASSKRSSQASRRKSSTSRRGSTNSIALEAEEKTDSRRSSARRSTNAIEIPSQVATLVIKNLSLDLHKEDVLRYLEERGAGAMDVDLHLDASGAFRGTGFARYTSPGKARTAMEKLGCCPEFDGRKARVEIQKSKALFGRKCLEAELPQEELGIVREQIEFFIKDCSRTEVELPTGLSVQQRKYAHSLAERHNLVHATRQGETGEKFVYLSKGRPEPTDGRKKAHSVSYPTAAQASLLVPTPQGAKANRRASAPTFGADVGSVPAASDRSEAQRNNSDPSNKVTPMATEAAIPDFHIDGGHAPVARPPGLDLEDLAGGGKTTDPYVDGKP